MIIIINNILHSMIIFSSVLIWVLTYFTFKNTHKVSTAQKTILVLTALNAIISAFNFYGGLI